MGEFSAQDAIRPRWDPSLKDRAIRVLLGIAVVLVVLALLGYLQLRWFGLDREPLLLLLAVVGPLKTAGLLVAGALAVRLSRAIGCLLRRIPYVFFWGGVVAVIGLVWAHALVFALVDRVIEEQGATLPAQQTLFGGPLTVEAIQTWLLTDAERAANEAALAAGEILPVQPKHGRLAMLAYPLWPLQFGLVRDLVAIGGVVGFVSIVAMFAIWWERKVAARIQSRMGPMRVGGWHGWAQSLADGIKLIQKEDIVLKDADRPLFRLAPYMAFIPALSTFIVLPFGLAWVFRDLDVALIFILAMLGIEVISVILAGWASNNKWSVYGAMREACQMVSYEVPLGLSLLIPVMTAGTLRLTEIGAMQGDGFHSWLAFSNPFTFLAAFTFFVAALASCKRAPFDLPEAESELVSGYHTEYSGFRFSLFFFAEYSSMFVVCGLATILFFGAWHSPLPASWGAGWAEGALWQQALHGVLFSGPLWFIAKAFALLYVQIWIRWTLPRIRLDQVMYACVQVLIPATMVLLLGSTFWNLLVPAGSRLDVGANVVFTLLGGLLLLGILSVMAYAYRNGRRLVGSLAVDALPGS